MFAIDLARFGKLGNSKPSMRTRRVGPSHERLASR